MKLTKYGFVDCPNEKCMYCRCHHRSCVVNNFDCDTCNPNCLGKICKNPNKIESWIEYGKFVLGEDEYNKAYPFGEDKYGNRIIKISEQKIENKQEKPIIKKSRSLWDF